MLMPSSSVQFFPGSFHGYFSQCFPVTRGVPLSNSGNDGKGFSATQRGVGHDHCQ